MIKNSLDGGSLASVKEAKKNQRIFEKKVGHIFKELEEKF